MAIPASAARRTGLPMAYVQFRADLRYLHQAMQLSYVRSGLCRAVGDEIWIQKMVGEDVEICMDLLKCYGLGMMDGASAGLEPLGLE